MLQTEPNLNARREALSHRDSAHTIAAPAPLSSSTKGRLQPNSYIEDLTTGLSTVLRLLGVYEDRAVDILEQKGDIRTRFNSSTWMYSTVL